MATNFEIASFNLTNWANAQAQLNSGNPMDVTIPMKDSNGNIVNVTVPNRGRFQQRVWDDVGNALGQFDRTFYVDQVNGDDTNDGSSGSPFKSLDKAFDSFPIGGFGMICIIGKYVNRSLAITMKPNTYITIYVKDNAYIEFETQYDSTHDYAIVPTIVINNSVLNLFVETNDNVQVEARSKFKQTDPMGYLNKNLHPSYSGFFRYESSGSGVSVLTLRTRIEDSTVNIFELQKGYIYFRSNLNNDFSTIPIMNIGLTHYTGTLARFTSNDAKILQIVRSAIINLNGDIVDENGQNINYADRIAGIIKDSNGIPRNIISNIVF